MSIECFERHVERYLQLQSAFSNSRSFAQLNRVHCSKLAIKYSFMRSFMYSRLKLRLIVYEKSVRAEEKSFSSPSE